VRDRTLFKADSQGMLVSSPTQPTQPDLFTAAFAPDAPQSLGNVKVG
jgi:hypothetical protein